MPLRRTGAAFSSSKCPANANASCELPFGFVWTPLLEDSSSDNDAGHDCDSGAVIDGLPPVLCITCLSYMNIYSKVNPENNRWVCPLCKCDNVLPPKMEHILVSPTTEFHQPLGSIESNTILAKETVVLVIDANLLTEDARAIGAVLQEMQSENKKQQQFGLIIFGKYVSVYRLGIHGISAADAITGDGISTNRLGERSYLSESLDTLTLCLQAKFGSAVEETAETSGFAKPPKSRLQLLKERKEARVNAKAAHDPTTVVEAAATVQQQILPTSPWSTYREHHPPPALRCTGEAIQCAIDLASHQTSTGRILVFTNGCPNTGDGSVCEGGQIEAGRLARASEYFDVLAKAAEGIGMDVFCTGTSELGMPVFQSLVEPSSGYVLLHDTFSSHHLRRNLTLVLQKTCISLAEYEEPVVELSEHNIESQDSLSPQYRSWIDGCTVDIRLSSFLNPTHLIGPGDLVESPTEPLTSERSAFEEGAQLALEQPKLHVNKRVPSLDMLQSSLTRIRLGRYDPLSTFSVMLRINDFFQHDEFAFVQCIVRYVNMADQTLVTRVHTHRLSVASDVGEFLEAVDEEVVPVLLGKEAVYRSMFGRDVDVDHPFHAPHVGQLDSLAYDAQLDLDNTIFRISGAFRLLSLEEGTRTIDLTEEGGVRAAGSSMDFAFPPELSDALRRLYHLRRGPLLSPGPLQSVDDRAEIRSLFVRLPLEDCLSIMAPSLWSSGDVDIATANGPSMDDVPPETLSLWENRIIAADLWHSLFIWSGSATLSPEFDAIRKQLTQHLLSRSEKRFPAPSLHFLKETDSMSRRFTALLGPSHGDPVEHQLAHFPALAQLSTDEQSKLLSRFKFYDPETDPSFRKWFWEVASASSKSREEGISLCD